MTDFSFLLQVTFYFYTIKLPTSS